GHRDELVGRLEDVEDGRQPQIEDVVESEDADPHGNNDIKDGVIATSRKTRPGPTVESEPVGSKEDQVTLTRSLFVRPEAKPGKEKELASFLKQGLELAEREKTTPVWFATQLGP